MGIRREYLCPGHGPFESEEPRCPRGCTIAAEREFRTAPAVHGGLTAKTDALLRTQVEAFGLSNIRSARTGETSRPVDPRAAQMAEFTKAVRSRYPSNWGSLPSGEGAIPSVLQQHGAPATKGIDRDALAAAKPPVQYIRDPDNLKVKTA